MACTMRQRLAGSVGKALRPLLREPGLRRDVLEDRGGVRLRRRLRPVRRLLVGLEVLRLDGRRAPARGHGAAFEQRLAEARERIGRPRGGELLGRAVELLPVGVRVGVDPDDGRVHDRAAGARADVRDRLAHRAEGVEDVEAVAVDDADVLEPGEVVARAFVGGLVRLRNRDAVAVVLNDEDDGQLLARGAVDGLEEVAFGGRGLADRAEDDRVLSVGLDRAAEAGGVLRVVRDAGRDVLDADLGLGEVVGHVAAARGDVGRLGHAVQEDLLGRQAGGDTGRQVAVVGEEVVPAGPERHAEGELDGVVPGAGGVVAPAEPLLQVVGRPVVEDPGQVHERVPFLQLFARDPGGGWRDLGSLLWAQRPPASGHKTPL